MYKYTERVLGGMLFFSLFISCGKTNESSLVKLNYHFIENGCDTLRHEFESESYDDALKKQCEALMDHNKNNYCAYGLRKNRFDRLCSKTNLTWYN